MTDMNVDQAVRVCAETDLAEGEIKAFILRGKSILFARKNGRIFALDDVCSHDGAHLRDGDIVGGNIQCARHGGRFDLETGEATQMPAVVGIESYNVEVKDGDVYVFLKK
jgi:3-phenylpropionate/trans-cinnamate dioxygenase ferredoxin subunit